MLDFAFTQCKLAFAVGVRSNIFQWLTICISFYCERTIKAYSHQAKTEAKAKIFFDVLSFILWSFLLVIWSFSLLLPLPLGVNGPLPSGKFASGRVKRWSPSAWVLLHMFPCAQPGNSPSVFTSTSTRLSAGNPFRYTFRLVWFYGTESKWHRTQFKLLWLIYIHKSGFLFWSRFRSHSCSWQLGLEFELDFI